MTKHTTAPATAALCTILDRVGPTELVSDALSRWVERPTKADEVSARTTDRHVTVLSGEVGFLDITGARWVPLCRWTARISQCALDPWALAAILDRGAPVGRVLSRVGAVLRRPAPQAERGSTCGSWTVRTTATRDDRTVAVVDEAVMRAGITRLLEVTDHVPAPADGDLVADLDRADRDLVSLISRRRALARSAGTPLSRWARHDELLTEALRNTHPRAIAHDLVSGLTRRHPWRAS